MKNKQTNKQSKENYCQYYLPNCAQGLIFCFESPENKIKGNLCTENHGQPNIKTHKPQEQPKDEGGTVVKANNNNNKKKQHQCIQYVGRVNQFSSALINLSCKTRD